VCGRYSLAVPDPGQLRARFPIGEQVEVRERFNVAPGDEVLAVTTDRSGKPRGELLRWGLVPPWSERPGAAGKMINARAETVAEKPAYRSAFERFRCLIIADGFYEWRRISPGPKDAFHITRPQGEPFAFAGLWSVWHRGQPDAIRSCTIITTAANTAVAQLHDRMPVVLDPSQEDAWLDSTTPAERLHQLLAGLTPAETAVRQVGPAVNDARYDGPECLADPLPAAQDALFRV
jgi:putative SOS response-associated peptidase YedK